MECFQTFSSIAATSFTARHDRTAASLRSVYLHCIKPCFDKVIAGAALIICFPLIAVCAFAIVLESPGRPFYTQRRVGMNGRIFKLYKLRSMTDGSESESCVTIENDRRITRIGRFLRAAKIDELPQLWNVIRGEMSLIGPRPLSVTESDYISSVIGFSVNYPGFYPAVRPGLTGLEQVRRTRQLSYQERFGFNHSYELTVSPLTDLTIFLATARLCRFLSFATAGMVALEALVLVWLLPANFNTVKSTQEPTALKARFQHCFSAAKANMITNANSIGWEHVGQQSGRYEPSSRAHYTSE